MPKLENYTPFPNLRYYSSDNKGREFGIIIVKGSYFFAPSGRLLIAEEQSPMVFTDIYHGEVNVTSLKYPSDLVPSKPGTDIIVNAVARAPDGRQISSWVCGVGVDDGKGRILALQSLRVTGPRWWTPKWKRALSDQEKREWQQYRQEFEGWELSAPEPITELPLRYEYAYGGSKLKGCNEEGSPLLEWDSHNPIGRGAIDKDWTDHTKPVPAPQIEARDNRITDAYRAYPPANLCPIPPAWEPRLSLGGTYDESWSKNVWPNWPKDYSFTYHNSAHPRLICQGHLRGDERVSLLNLVPGLGAAIFDLPGDRIRLDLVRTDGRVDEREMALDTVMIDIASDARRRRRVCLSWRLNFPPDIYDAARIHLRRRNMTGQEVRALIRQRLNERAA